jgi:hypothetical protein
MPKQGMFTVASNRLTKSEIDSLRQDKRESLAWMRAQRAKTNSATVPQADPVPPVAKAAGRAADRPDEGGDAGVDHGRLAHRE